jgi:hypothetical protein
VSRSRWKSFLLTSDQGADRLKLLFEQNFSPLRGLSRIIYDFVGPNPPYSKIGQHVAYKLQGLAGEERTYAKNQSADASMEFVVEILHFNT